MPVEASALEPPLRVLVVEDASADARLLGAALRDARARVDLQQVGSLAEAERAVRESAFDCVLLDLGLPDASGADNVQRIRHANRGQAVVIIAGLGGEEAAGMQQPGAQDAHPGRFDGAYILRVIRRAVERNRALNQVDQLREYQYYIATHDPSTGLPNRRLFEDRAGVVLAQAQRDDGCFAVGCLHLDGFKPLNETYGRAGGDAVLRAIGQALSESVRATDTVARAGGDEFLVLLTALKRHAAVDVGAMRHRLLERVLGVRKVDGRDVQVSASLGLAFYPQHGRTVESLLMLADQAMYRHKRRGEAVAESAPAHPGPRQRA